MRVLVFLVLVAALGWGGYWYVGARATETAVESWLDQRRSEGWQADATHVTTRGFPNRFDTTLESIVLADPSTGVAWTAPFFQILSLSYKPNHIIAVFPQEHRIATPTETVEFRSTQTRGSIVFEPDSLLELERTSFEVEGLSAESSRGWSVFLSSMQLATRQSGPTPDSYDLAFSGTDIVPGGIWSDVLDGTGLPQAISDLSVDATVGFSAPWDRLAVERARPQPRKIVLRNARAEWGELLFQASGELDVDAAGWPTGSISVQARNWRDMLNLAVAVGAIPAEALPTLGNGLGMLAGLSGNPDHIDAVLNFRNGLIAVGPLPIGRAPNLAIR